MKELKNEVAKALGVPARKQNAGFQYQATENGRIHIRASKEEVENYLSFYGVEKERVELPGGHVGFVLRKK